MNVKEESEKVDLKLNPAGAEESVTGLGGGAGKGLDQGFELG